MPACHLPVHVVDDWPVSVLMGAAELFVPAMRDRPVAERHHYVDRSGDILFGTIDPCVRGPLRSAHDLLVHSPFTGPRAARRFHMKNRSLPAAGAALILTIAGFGLAGPASAASARARRTTTGPYDSTAALTSRDP